MSSIKTTIELCVDGYACEREVTLHYEYHRADGDGWNEPRTPVGVTLCCVDVEHVKHSTSGLVIATVDLMFLLTKECIENIEADLLEKHEESLQPDPDWQRELSTFAATSVGSDFD